MLHKYEQICVIFFDKIFLILPKVKIYYQDCH